MTETEMSYIDKKEIKMTLRKYLNKEDQYTTDMHQIYYTIVGKCSDAMIQKMKADADYTTVEYKCDTIGILRIIRKICYSCQAEQFAVLSLVKALKRLISLKQGPKETNGLSRTI